MTRLVSIAHPRITALLLGSAAVAALIGGAVQAAAIEAGTMDPITITVSNTGCSPASVSVAPGKTVFKIKNDSQRRLEWEILKGVMVVEERENIVPGFVQTLTATLDPGDYQMTCGLLSNPKGILKVAVSDAPIAPPSPMDLVGPIAQYKVYVTSEVTALVDKTRIFVAAIKAGNLEEAKAAYAPARLHYERIEPVAELFSDLDTAIDVREDDFEKKAADPAFTGFHRIEKAIFADGTTKGLDVLADKLMSDVLDLQKRVDGLVITPKAMVGGAAGLVEEVAATKISGEEDRYSRTDLWDFSANIDGAQKIVDLLRPLVEKQDPALDARVRENFAKVDAVLAKYKVGTTGFESYEKLTEQDRNGLKGPVTTLAEDLSTLRGKLGIN
ncbi:iron uptake system protein EfeO [Lichenihabitans psoromatis]|uniref:iron uptake system protein EfeO n=1 Tax=Lichenihabitans psoromatis TaxID=2528642 RepID=UPI0010383B76|nr:iron uptake system protein EfeO [Lichenihabitans psoromatis]